MSNEEKRINFAEIEAFKKYPVDYLTKQAT